MAQDHERALALLGEVHADPVGLDEAVADGGHEGLRRVISDGIVHLMQATGAFRPRENALRQ
jgi:hypothetical protein